MILKYFSLAILFASLFFVQPAFAAKDMESVYERVMRTGKIKCGYIIHQPFVFVEPNSGEVKGVTHDLVNEMADRLSLEVEWVREAGWSSFIEDLKVGSYDLLCTTIYANAARARYADFSRDIHYSPLVAWVRADDKRFDNIKNIDSLDDPAYTLSLVDGSAQEILSHYRFTKVKKHFS